MQGWGRLWLLVLAWGPRLQLQVLVLPLLLALVREHGCRWMSPQAQEQRCKKHSRGKHKRVSAFGNIRIQLVMRFEVGESWGLLPAGELKALLAQH